MSTHGDYFGEVTHALTNLTADQSASVRDRLVPRAATPEDLPKPEPRSKQPCHDQPVVPVLDPGMPLFVTLEGPGVIGL
ncbi:hypothetical protein [Segniliparus rugosus]|uniref:Uncharacterized protein n=1 Tax=Segniliparus rugosus (strain ATCC BAA-974 / DSM 45345 / CCUG 50838 / CIP 108380 / JCM 13579 / CDC 945) TaxID=679197 RepID=E5XSV0_SEGRC|nr:hypothetical protein [Segniliparus rugosus]EFV12566.1 hypothetical protein HMPREF9336_02572 [Segniliparus rugosus ATCC BAA-974]